MTSTATPLLQDVTCETVSDAETGRYRVEITATETGERLFTGPPRKTVKLAHRAAITGLARYLNLVFTNLERLLYGR